MEGNPWGYGQPYASRSTRPSPPPAHGDVSRFDISLLDPSSLNPAAYSAATTHPAFGAARSFTSLPQMNYGIATLPPTLPQLFDPMSSLAQGFAAYPAYKVAAFPGMETSHHTLEHMLPQAKYVPATSMTFPTSSAANSSSISAQDVHSSIAETAKGWGLSNFLPSQSVPFGNLPTDIATMPPELFVAGMVNSQRASSAERARSQLREGSTSSSPHKTHSSDNRSSSRSSTASYHSDTAGQRMTPAHQTPAHQTPAHQTPAAHKSYSHTQAHLSHTSPENLPRAPSHASRQTIEAMRSSQESLRSQPTQASRKVSEMIRSPPEVPNAPHQSIKHLHDMMHHHLNPSRQLSESVKRSVESIRQPTETFSPQETLRHQQETLRHQPEHRKQESVRQQPKETSRQQQEAIRQHQELLLQQQAEHLRQQELLRQQSQETSRQQAQQKTAHLLSPQGQSVDVSQQHQTELRIPSRHYASETSQVPSKARKAEQFVRQQESMMQYSFPTKASLKQEPVSSPPQDLTIKNPPIPQQHYAGVSTQQVIPQQAEKARPLQQFYNSINEPSGYTVKTEPSPVYQNMQNLPTSIPSTMNYDPISPVSDTPQNDSYSTVNIQDLSAAVVRSQSMNTHLGNTSQSLGMPMDSNKVIQDLSNSYAVPQPQQNFDIKPDVYPPSLSHLPSHGNLPLPQNNVPVAPPVQAVADSTTKTKKRPRKKKMTPEERQEAQIKALFDDDGYKPNLMTDDFLDQIQQSVIPGVTAIPQVNPQEEKKKKKRPPKKKVKDEEITQEYTGITTGEMFQNPANINPVAMNAQFTPQPQASPMTPQNLHPQQNPNFPGMQQRQDFANMNCEYRQDGGMSTNPSMMSPPNQMNPHFNDVKPPLPMLPGYPHSMGPTPDNPMFPGMYNPQLNPGMMNQFPIPPEYMGMVPPNMYPDMMAHMNAFGDPNLRNPTTPQKDLPKAVISQPEMDDEFQHLTTPPKIPVYKEPSPEPAREMSPPRKLIPQQRKRRNLEDIEQAPAHTIVLPDPSKPLPKAQTIYENSFLSFIQGDRGETLSSLMDTSSRKIISSVKHRAVTNLTKRGPIADSPTWIEMSPEHDNAGDWWGFSDDEDNPKKKLDKSATPKLTAKPVMMKKKVPNMNNNAKTTPKPTPPKPTLPKSSPLTKTHPVPKPPPKKKIPAALQEDDEPEIVRVQTSRKAKEVAKTKSKKKKKEYSDESDSNDDVKNFSEGEGGYDSDDDPAWNPYEGEGADAFDAEKIRKSRSAAKISGAPIPRASHMPQTIKSFNEALNLKKKEKVPSKDKNNEDKEESEGEEEVVQKPKSPIADSDKYTLGRYMIEEKDLVNYDNYPIWKISDTKMLQKFEFTLENGKTCHNSTFTYSSWVPSTMMSQFHPIEVKELIKGKKVIVLDEYQPKPPTDGSLEEAYEDHPLVEMFNVYMQIFLSQALEPTFLCAIRDANDEFYLHPLNRIDTLIKSQILEVDKIVPWNPTFKTYLDDKPMLRELDRKNLSANCQACTKSNQTAIKSVHLYGDSYDRYTLESTSVRRACTKSNQTAIKSVHLYGDSYDRYTLESTSKDTQQNTAAKEFMVGKLVNQHISRYHQLRHYKYQLLQRCTAKVKLLREHNDELDNPEILDKALQNRAWVLKLFEEIKKLLEVT